jgi:hypothetical protein
MILSDTVKGAGIINGGPFGPDDNELFQEFKDEDPPRLKLIEFLDEENIAMVANELAEYITTSEA